MTDIGKYKIRYRSTNSEELPVYDRNSPAFSLLPPPAAEARRAVQRRLSVVPLKPRSKVPSVPHGIDDAITTRKGVWERAKTHPNDNYGIVLDGEIFVIDIDGPKGRASLKALERQHGELPATVETITPRGGHRLYRSRPGQLVPSSSGKLGKGIDVKGQRSHVVMPGSMHPNGKRYQYAPGRALGKIEIAEAPGWLLRAVLRARRRDDQVPRRADAAARVRDDGRIDRYGKAALNSELDALRQAEEGERNIALNKAGFTLTRLSTAGAFDEATVRANLTETAREIGLEEGEIRKTLDSAMGAGRRTPRDLDHLANSTGKRQLPEPVVDDPLAEELAAFGETEADNAHRFARRFRQQIAHVRGVGFFAWNGRFWEPGAEILVVRRAEDSARAIEAEAQYLNGEKAQERRLAFANASLSRAGLERAVALARSHLDVPISAFDAHPNLLPVENGTLDLQTGTLGPHDPAHRLTRMVPIAFDAAARCPVFKRFLRDRVGDEEVIAFLQKAVGLSLTGHVSEQVLFFLLGTGQTGKSTFINLLRLLLGGFAVHTPVETFTTKTFESIRTDLARMAGARLVTAGEIHPSQQFDEALIKGMTGGDAITARYMRQNLFEYMPQFKIWLYANHPPRARATDDAFWRRIRVVPFDKRVPDDKVAGDLPQLLRAELAGILNWAVEGCLAWRAEGLEPPAAVREATQAWRHGADHVARFLRERTVPAAEAKLAAKDLLHDFKTWCTAAGEKEVSAPEFKKRVTALGWRAKHTNKGSMWLGLRLRS